ncbi:RHS repeat-associated core domain-containing protein [Kitasatospora azatica]|uniref:RHS repeat-associated core domain-containing protein n=1 Tax=Kitasatospora azatica TaxID=58347 RepID=UPI00068C7A87|nr:RHS repeat-associated core domain-containing protein [Kitasatospora azatica]
MSLVAPLAEADSVVGGYRYKGKVWAADPLPAQPKVKGHPAGSTAKPAGPGLKGARALNPHKSTAPAWPGASTATVDVGSAGTGPVSITPAPGTTKPAANAAAADGATSSAPAAVRVVTADHEKAQAANVDGLLLGLSRADGSGGDGQVSVSVDYSAIAQAYGGGWASRLHLVAMPACALTTPQLAECRTQQPLATTNDTSSNKLTATVALPGSATVKASLPAGQGKVVPAALVNSQQAAVTAASTASSGTAVAAVSGMSGSQGNYGTTSLSASGSWSQSGSGAFSYNYAIPVPPSLGGTAPAVGLSYDSQSVDGETSARNSQSSWLGDGWSYSPGFVERSYKSCSNDGIKDSGDQCWAGWNATISLGSHTGQLVRDGSGQYHLQNDDGTKVELLTGASNGLWNGEYFKVTTTDGTQYYLGLNHSPGTTSDPATNSAWGTPVYMPKSGDPCYDSSKGDKSQCSAEPGYRFNLDFVVDVHGNVQRYDWANETNYYNMGYGQVAQSGGGGTMTAYTRGGYLTQISYGYKLADEQAGRDPGAKVVFTTAQRCVVSDTTCQYSNLSSSTATNWPDTPYDLNCTAGMATSGTGSNVCQVPGPSFWSTYRLKSINTSVKVGNSWQNVDSWALTHLFSDAGGTMDPVTGATVDPKDAGALQSVMWLSQIQHTGQDTSAGGSGTITMDPVTFTGIETDNRVDGLTPAAPPLFHPRISSIQTETGESIAVTYRAPECSRVNNTMPASADSDTMACYQVYWNTPGAKDPIADWFQKTLVSQVSDNDATKAGSPAKITKYAYSGGAAWHRDDNELTDDQYRTWNDFRGFRTVTTTTGAAPDPITQTTVNYLQGMDGDYKADGSKRSVSLTDSTGVTVADSNWLGGTPQETDTYTQAGGSIVAKSIPGAPVATTTVTSSRTAWTSKTPAPATLSTLPDLTARRTQSTSARELSLLANGSWRTTSSSTSYDSQGRLYQQDDKGDISVPSQETCTTTSYATAPAANPMMLLYPSETVAVSGACGTAASATTTISDKRYFYDGDGTVTNPGTLGQIGANGSTLGLVTASQSVKNYDGGGNPVFQTLGAATYDQYGRSTKAVDTAGSATTTSYLPASGTLPTSVSTSNPLGWTTSSTIAPARNLVTHSVDVNGRVTDSTYDALGRVSQTWLPGRTKGTQSPDKQFSYAVHGAGSNPDPSSVTTQSLREDNSYGSAVSIYDGFLQRRQTQATTADNSAGRLLSSAHYDSHGWLHSSVAAFVDTTTAPGSTLFVEAENTVPSETVTSYDGMGRGISQTLYSKASPLWTATSAYPGADEVDRTPQAGGTPTSVFTNALGQTTAQVAHGGPGIGDVTTSYTYTPAGQTASIKDTAGHSWTYTYDLQGRKTAQTDPDTGSTLTGYDQLGNTASVTDGRGQVLSFTYDLFGRKTGEYAGTSTTDQTKQLAGWSYDTLAKGYPTSAIRYVGGSSTGGSAYTQTVAGYTAAYQPTGSTVTIPAAEKQLAGTYTVSAKYTPNTGLLSDNIFGTEGSLPSEDIGFGYNLQGGLVATGSDTTPYLDVVSYSPLGRVLQSTYGVLGKQLRTAQTYDDATGRLTTNRVSLQTATTNPISATTYGYDPSGNLTSTSELQSSGGTDQVFDTQCFQYDGLRRLTTAWTDTAGQSSATAGQLAHCNSASPAPAKIGGPAPYWQSWQYNLLGDRVQQVKHDVTGNTAKDVTQTSSYPTGGAQPNTVSSVTTTGPTGTSVQTPHYDAAGNTKDRATTGVGAGSQTFSYDEEGRTKSVSTTVGTGTAQQTSYLYDANGNLLIQRGPGSTLLYLFNGAELLTLTGTAVTGQRYYTNPDGTVICRSSNGTVNYLPATRQRTAQLQVDAKTLTVTRRAFDPYGNPRGTVPGTWADNSGYLGQPTDPTTGLDLLGARHYDPALGRFLTADPLLETDDPNQIGGYTYAGDNPSTGSDPTGLSWYNDWDDFTDAVHSGANEVGTFIGGVGDSVIGVPYAWGVNTASDCWNGFADFWNSNLDDPLGVLQMAHLGHTGHVDEHPLADLFNMDTNSTAYQAGEWTGTVVGLVADGVTVFKAASAGIKAIRGIKAIDEAGGIINWVKRLVTDDKPHPTTPKVEPPAPPTVKPTDPGAGTGKPGAGSGAKPGGDGPQPGTGGAYGDPSPGHPRVTGDGVESTLDGANPGGHTDNCAACAAAGDNRMAGGTLVAWNSGITYTTDVENYFGRVFYYTEGVKDIRQQMTALGYGARGVIFAENDASEIGHFFNVVNDGGRIKFLDYQSESYANLGTWDRFYLMVTHGDY